MSYLYLASPYTHPDEFVREERYLEALDALHWLLSNRQWAYSPIVHCHELAKRQDLPKDFEFWGEFNHLMIRNSRGIVVLQSDGWEESRGVANETLYAKERGLAMFYMLRQGLKYAVSPR